MIKTAIVLAFLTPFQNEQNEKHLSPQVKSVISRFVRAKGGKSALENVKNYTIKGEVVSGTDTVGTFEIWQAANRHLSIDHFPDGSSRSHGTDGKIAWRLDVDGKPSILQGQDARDYVRHYASLHESLEWTKQFATILYAGEKKIDNQSVMLIGHEKGNDTETRLKHNFGMAHPEGYRKSIRLMRLAEQFNIPVITFVDTPGAYPGIGAEERGQSEAIARSTDCTLSLKVPVISIIIGEGGSGRSFGIDGGIGVFGSVAIDRHWIPMIP